MDRHVNLTADHHIRIDKGVQRLTNAAARRILYRNKAQVAVIFAHLIENRADIGHRLIFHALAELQHRRRMAETALGSQIRNSQRTLQAKRTAHQLTPDRPQRFVRQRTFVFPGDLVKDLFLPGGSINRRMGHILHLANLYNDVGAGIEKLHELGVKPVNLFS